MLNKLPSQSKEWRQLIEIRTKYDDRLEFLRELETNKHDTSNDVIPLNSTKKGDFHFLGLASPSGKSRRQSQVAFEDLHLNNNDTIDTGDRLTKPSSAVECPYWQLRIIKQTILTGGYITPNVYIPKVMWSQIGLKFSGLSAKTIAFQNIIQILTSNTGSLQQPDTLIESIRENISDETALNEVATQFQAASSSMKSIHDDLIALQNHLSKPFPFIKEVQLEEVVESPETPPTSSVSSQVSRLTNMAIALGKNVKKYAEVGYQRLGTIPTRVSEDEFAAYTLLICNMCDQCQYLNSWYTCTQSLRDLIAKSSSSIKDATYDTLVKYSEKILEDLHSISIFMRDVVCEILLRDIESLMERYLNKMRKSFSRMYWDLIENE